MDPAMINNLPLQIGSDSVDVSGLAKQLDQIKVHELNEISKDSVRAGSVQGEYGDIIIIIRDNIRWQILETVNCFKCCVLSLNNGSYVCLLSYNNTSFVVRFSNLKDLINIFEKVAYPHLPLAKNHPLIISNCSSKVPIYTMTRFPRGIAMIINNVVYNAPGLEKREGSGVDVKNLKDMFRISGYMTVVQFNDLTDSEMMIEVKKMAAGDHREYDCFICCILAHGGRGTVKGVNGKDVQLQTIFSQFRGPNCPSLVGKPKLFFIQACQGSQEQRNVVAPRYQSDVIRDETPVHMAAEGEDFFIACSTEPGFVSYRHPEKGSVFITSLSKNVLELCDHSLSDIMHTVCSDIAKANEDSERKQVPWYSSTLTKTCVLRPLYVNST
ncbi:caspase-3-like [Gigantopelta aegis]|uniref:caspase-3-like n=1 Tax=Gigantopelta aegis TaxID=1735272 RepID=UPI001B88E46E|nr:caspase-3-like [Gigantopelta aegis]